MKKGFTLVEVMLTLAIVSTVLAISMNLLSSQNKKLQENLAEFKNSSKFDKVKRILSHDIRATKRIRSVDNGFEINTFSHIRNSDLEVKLIPTIVRYEIVKTECGSWLTRSQKNNKNWDRTLVASGVESLNFYCSSKSENDNIRLSSEDKLTVLLGSNTDNKIIEFCIE